MSRYNVQRSIGLVGAVALASVAVASDTCQVTLRHSDPTWNRPRDTGSTVSVACSATAPDSQNDGVPYRIIEFRTTVVEPLQVTVTSLESPTTGFDPFAGLYCSAFNPMTPATNLIALDDDSAGYPNAQIGGANQSIMLTPNTDYVLIVSAYSAAGAQSTPYGKVQVTVLGHAVFSQTLAGCCKADYDQNGVVNVSDIFAFLRGWFAHETAADIDGNGTVNVSDIFAYLRTWFAKCA